MSRPQTVSRADLLRLLALQPDAPLAAAARLAGYQPEAASPPAAQPDTEAEAGYETAPADRKALFPAEQFWHLRRREPLQAAAGRNLSVKLRQFRPLRAKELRLTASPSLPRRRPDPAALTEAAAQFRPLPRRPAQAESSPPPQTPPAALALQLLRAGEQPAWLEPFFLRFLRTWFERQKDADLIGFARQALELLPPGRQQDWQGCLYGIAHRDALRQGAAIPPQFQPEAALAAAAEPLPPSPWLLIQEGEAMFLLNSPESGICLLKGSRIAALELTSDLLLLRREDGRRAETVPVRSGQPLFTLRGAERFSLQTAAEVLHIHACVRPSWAALIGRNSRELFAELPWLGRSHRLYWQAPARSGEGRWVSCHGPADTDHFGLSAYIGFYGRVMQRFRWLEPGRFLMGSPLDEPERETWGRETQHEVRLSKGFWLADTAVTQELWHFVMRGNPSKFQGRELPADNVSWEDAQLFLLRLNAMVPGLNARLPTEAEWEYACRAGSGGPFSFGGQITPEQANCNGAFPYHNSTKGEFRRRTVPVQSLPPNAWGFYEMHGNVWEWCQDWWQEDLGCDAALDPQGPDCGEFRAARGGSWFLGGKAARSAARGRFAQDFRNDRIGFRIARDHELPLLAQKAAAPVAEDPPPLPRPSLLRRIFSRPLA